MKKRLLITGLVVAALLLALYGVILGDRLMLPLAVAFPTALLPIAVLLATLRWMALATD